MARPPKPVAGVYERVPGSDIWSARIRVNGKLVRKSFGRGPAGRAHAIAWVEKARTIKRTGEGVLPATARRPALTTAEVAVLGDPDAITVGTLCDEFLRYVKAHPEEYRDQVYPPRRIAEIRKAFGDRKAAGLKSSEIENWLDAIQEKRDLENSTVNKMRRHLFHDLQAWKAEGSCGRESGSGCAVTGGGELEREILERGGREAAQGSAAAAH